MGVVYAYPSAGPWVRANMVSSLDGAAAISGTVGELTGREDQRLLGLLRSLSDVLLVGAGTIAAEGYGPVRTAESDRVARDANGARALPHPRLAVISGSLDLDWDSPAFREAPVRPLIITAASSAADRRHRAAEVAEVIVSGDDAVDLDAAIDALHERGLTRVLSEGGPSALGGLLAAGRLDEMCLTLSPRMVGGAETTRITAATGPPTPTGFVMRSVIAASDGALFLRYSRD